MINQGNFIYEPIANELVIILVKNIPAPNCILENTSICSSFYLNEASKENVLRLIEI